MNKLFEIYYNNNKILKRISDWNLLYISILIEILKI